MMIRLQKTANVARGTMVASLLLLGCVKTPAQKPVAPAVPVTPSAPEVTDLPEQQELLRLVKLSPTLERVVERDPTLLSDQAYVERNNPELAAYLTAHPEIGRNPDFWLFTEFRDARNRTHPALPRRTAGEQPVSYSMDRASRILDELVPFLVFVCLMAGVIWIVYVILQNRRWNRVSKMQVETHSRLMERFGSSAELMQYMNSDAGRRFLEAAPISLENETSQRMPNAISRVLISLQVGLVMTLLGAGLVYLRNSVPDDGTPLLVTGTVFLMPGIGFVLSAIVTFFVALRLGMIPQRGGRNGAAGATMEQR